MKQFGEETTRLTPKVPASGGPSQKFKPRFLHEHPGRFKRAAWGVFIGEIAFFLIAYLLLGKLKSSIDFPLGPLRYLTLGALIVHSIVLVVIVRFKKFLFAIDAMAILFSLLYAPTLCMTGGFISPFNIVYLQIMILSNSAIDLVHRLVGKVVAVIIITSYVVVSLLQFSGIELVSISYVTGLLHNRIFFWLVFSVTLATFVNSFFSISLTTKNITETLTELVVAHWHVAQGTARYVGQPFFVHLMTSLSEALGVKTAFLIDWSTSNKINGTKKTDSKIYLSDKKTVTEKEVELGSGIINTIVSYDSNSIEPLQYLPAEFESHLGYSFSQTTGFWIKVTNATGQSIGLLGILDPEAIIKETLVCDIMNIFSSRAGAELDRIIAEKKQSAMRNELAHGQKMQAVGQLAAGIAHDFNNLITGMIGFAQLITLKLPADSPLQSPARKIMLIGKQSGDLVAQLLNYGRRTEMKKIRLQLNTIVDNTIDILYHSLHKNIKINHLYENENGEILGDTAMVQSAVLNLGINARDAMPHGGELSFTTNLRTVEESTERDSATGRSIPSGRYVTLEVKDTGTGITPEIIDKLFEPFFTTKELGHGTGLGLATVFSCVDSHNGYIVVSSKLSIGTTFLLYFPVLA